ncbi:Os07g0137500, partial [Oryza sativa Japonica Group]
GLSASSVSILRFIYVWNCILLVVLCTLAGPGQGFNTQNSLEIWVKFLGVTKHPRYKKREGVLVFELGMKFNGKKQFKKAMTRYVLAEKKVVNFMKDDHKRVRVTCDWDSYPWVCLLSKNSRSDSWQIVTYESLHAWSTKEG